MIRLAPVYSAAYLLRDPRRKQPWRDQQPVRRARRKLARHHRGLVRFLIEECLGIDRPLANAPAISIREFSRAAEIPRPARPCLSPRNSGSTAAAPVT